MGKAKAVYPFVCEKCKAAPARRSGFHRQYRWKTEKGFHEHKCYTGNPEMARKRAETRARNEQARRVEVQRQHDERMRERERTAAHKPGEVVFASVYIVTQPTHSERYGRRVRVRYEEGRRYEARAITIEYVTMIGYYGLGFHFGDGDIFPTLAEARASARSREAKYKEHCESAEMCR